jgi:hypothetical protein
MRKLIFPLLAVAAIGVAGCGISDEDKIGEITVDGDGHRVVEWKNIDVNGSSATAQTGDGTRVRFVKQGDDWSIAR